MAKKLIKARIARDAIKRLRSKHAEAIAFTILTIAESPLVCDYVIGYTSKQGLIRRAAYNRVGFEHLVVLADRLTREDALHLEYTLQSYISDCKELSVYQKYNAAKRDRRYYRSAGQATADPNAHIHSVYMAWSEALEDD